MTQLYCGLKYLYLFCRNFRINIWINQMNRRQRFLVVVATALSLLPVAYVSTRSEYVRTSLKPSGNEDIRAQNSSNQQHTIKGTTLTSSSDDPPPPPHPTPTKKNLLQLTDLLHDKEKFQITRMFSCDPFKSLLYY